MSGLFGRPASSSQEIYAGMQVSTSLQGQVIPYVTGRTKVAFNLVWYGNFASSGGSSSSKGGGGSSNGVSYSCAFIAALALGPCKGIYTVYHDRSITSLTEENLSYALGSIGQATWTGYPSGTPTLQEIPYSNICYVATPAYNLGSSASMPNLQFELEGIVGGYSNAHGMYDADISAVIVDYLTNPVTGANFLGTIQNLTGNTNTFQAYCMALGLMVSNYENNQRAASDFMKELMQIANSDIVDSCGILRVVPYADAAVSGTTADGQTWSYTPDLTPVYLFTDSDYYPKKGQEPVQLKRKATSDTCNIVNIEWLDRSDYYNPSPASAQDNWDISIRGPRCMATITLHEITNAMTAKMVAQLILNTQLYERNTYVFRTRNDYWLLEPMDYIAITDSGLGLVGQVCRIIQIDEDEKNVLTFTVMEVPGTIRNTPQYNWSGAQGFFQNFDADPGPVQAPAIFVMPPIAAAASAGITLGIAVCGESSEAFWGGCDIYASDDGGDTYTWVGQVGGNGPGRYGTLTAALPAVADPDTSSTLSVLLADTNLQLSTTVTHADADASGTLILVGSGATAEVMAYGTGTLVAAGEYNLTYLRRGLYGSSPEAQSIGAQFVRLDAAIFQLPIDPGMAGQTLYFKFCSFNSVNRAVEEESSVTAYSYTIPTSLLLNTSSPAGLVASGSAVVNGTMAYMVSTAAAGWGNASVYTAESYSNGCSASCYPGRINSNFMMGLSTNPGASNSYTNINYALYVTSVPDIRIYESGTLVEVFGGAYTTSTLLNVVYDGKHVSYYIGGSLVRSVPVTGQAFFQQIAFETPSDSAYGIDFTPSGTAVTPFTLVPMANTVACAGTRAISNSLGTNGFGTKNFQSKESYTGGCFVSASINPVSGAQFIGLSKAPATGAAGGYGPILAGWYPHEDSSNCVLIFNGAANAGGYTGAAPTAADVFTITYDNFNFRWYRNNTLVFTQAYANAGPLYLFGDFYEDGLGFANIAFGPYSPSTPAQFVARGNAVVSDSFATKAGGAAGWDSDIVSVVAYSTCNLVWKPNDVTGQYMCSLVTAIPGSPGYTSLNYAIYCNLGNIQVYESGANVGTFGTYTITDRLSITYDGSTVTFAKNGTAFYTASASGLTLYADITFYTVGTGCNSIDWGPGATVPVVDTGQINTTAATSIVNTNVVGPTGVISSSLPLTFTEVASISVPAYEFDTTMVLTVTGVGMLFSPAENTEVEVTATTTSTPPHPSTLTQTSAGSARIMVTQNISASDSNEYANSFAFELYFAVSAGTPMAFYLWGLSPNASGSGAYAQIANANMKAEVIKR